MLKNIASRQDSWVSKLVFFFNKLFNSSPEAVLNRPYTLSASVNIFGDHNNKRSRFFHGRWLLKSPIKIMLSQVSAESKKRFYNWSTKKRKERIWPCWLNSIDLYNLFDDVTGQLTRKDPGARQRDSTGRLARGRSTGRVEGRQQFSNLGAGRTRKSEVGAVWDARRVSLGVGQTGGRSGRRADAQRWESRQVRESSYGGEQTVWQSVRVWGELICPGVTEGNAGQVCDCGWGPGEEKLGRH